MEEKRDFSFYFKRHFVHSNGFFFLSKAIKTVGPGGMVMGKQIKLRKLFGKYLNKIGPCFWSKKDLDFVYLVRYMPVRVRKINLREMVYFEFFETLPKKKLYPANGDFTDARIENLVFEKPKKAIKPVNFKERVKKARADFQGNKEIVLKKCAIHKKIVENNELFPILKEKLKKIRYVYVRKKENTLSFLVQFTHKGEIFSQTFCSSVYSNRSPNQILTDAIYFRNKILNERNLMFKVDPEYQSQINEEQKRKNKGIYEKLKKQPKEDFVFPRFQHGRAGFQFYFYISKEKKVYSKKFPIYEKYESIQETKIRAIKHRDKIVKKLGFEYAWQLKESLLPEIECVICGKKFRKKKTKHKACSATCSKEVSNMNQTHPTCLLYTSPSPRDS